MNPLDRPCTSVQASMTWPMRAALLALAGMLCACAQVPGSPAAPAPAAPAASLVPAAPPVAKTPKPAQDGVPAGIVSVTYADPKSMSDARQSPRETDRARRAWLDALCLHLADRAAPLLAPDQRLEVRLIDLQRAGAFEPGRGAGAGDVRIVRDIYPPRIDLEFTLRTEDGRVLQKARRQLRDAMFMSRSAASANDPLRYEKALIDDWLSSEIGRRTD